jgi:hypothetical protein
MYASQAKSSHGRRHFDLGDVADATGRKQRDKCTQTQAQHFGEGR